MTLNDRHVPAAPPDSATRSGGVEVVRSEEQLVLGSTVRVSGRAVLRKYVVTETITQTIQVRHEEVRVDHEPVDRAAGDRLAVGNVFDGRIVEVVLHREVPAVHLTVIPTERVWLHVDTITHQVQVSADLDRERIDLDLPGA